MFNASGLEKKLIKQHERKGKKSASVGKVEGEGTKLNKYANSNYYYYISINNNKNYKTNNRK
jgi:hypothetical protein